MLVLDEADRMLDMGFIHDVRKVAALCPKNRQSAMFSATMPPAIAKLAAQILQNAQRVEIARSGTAANRVEQNVMFIEKAAKVRSLLAFLADPAITRAIVFTRTKHTANRVSGHMEKAGIPAETLHGNKSQNARQRALAAFTAGKARVLVATDIAARGIDVDQVSHVINFDLPEEPETYIHRIGRTARAGAEGIAVSFCDSSERGALRSIEKLAGKALAVIGAPQVAEEVKEMRTATQAPTPARRDRRASRPAYTGKPNAAKPIAARAVATRPSTGKAGAGKTRSARPAVAAGPSGIVKWFNSAKGFGFVQPDNGGKDVYVHISEAKRAGLGTPQEGLRVSFNIERDERGRESATNLRAA